MEKSIAVLEISSSCVKIVIGYELNGKPQILYTLVKPTHQIIDNGVFVDVPLLQTTLQGLNKISDVSAKLSIKISEVILILPPYGLEVYNTKQITTVVGEESKVSNVDIRNVYNLIRKGQLPYKHTLVDIIPDKFILDGGTTYLNPPLGESSNALEIEAKIHMLPSDLLKNYEGITKQSGFAIKRCFVSSYTANELIISDKECPQDYILVDIGSHTTTVNAIGGKQLIASRHFSWGGHRITSKIATSFNISENEAEKIKVTYGLDRKKVDFPVPICITDDGNGNETKHSVSELNTIISNELSSFANQLNICINNLLHSIGADPQCSKKLPVILTGGGSSLNGLVQFIESKLQSDVVKTYCPNTIGARNAIFTNCLGAIIANKKHQAVFDESHPKIGTLTRGGE